MSCEDATGSERHHTPHSFCMLRGTVNMNLRILSFLATTALTLSVGCGNDEEAKRDADALADGPKTNAEQGERHRNGNLATEGFSVRTEDLNRDKQPDQWYFTDASGNASRVERDLNFDGDVDLWQYPDANGTVVEEEMDLDRDGRVDVVTYYDEAGGLTKKELALDFAGSFTVFKYYNEKGQLLRVEQDEDADGKVDRWDYYENDKRVRVGWDEDSDGIPETFDDV